MKAYPGKAKKLEQTTGPNIIFNQPLVYTGWTHYTLPKDFHSRHHELRYFPDYPQPHQPRGHGLHGASDQARLSNCKLFYEKGRGRSAEVAAALGEETLSLFPEALSSSSGSPRKKSKLSEKIAGKLSKLAMVRSTTASPVSMPLPAEVHSHARSVSVDGRSSPAAQVPLSRRQILASLEEERSLASSSASSSGSRWSASASPSSSPASSAMFSRACLLQSISREEDSCVWSKDSEERFPAGEQQHGRHKCDSLGEEDDSEAASDSEAEDAAGEGLQLGDSGGEDTGGWGGARHWFQEEEEDGVEDCLDQELHSLTLKSLKWIATLGVGGFGRVELVTVSQNNNNAFALKKMKKSEIQDTKQQQHILNEKLIMQSCDSPFIVKLYKTFHDAKFLYMLMEPCLGGELWTLLRRSKRFQDTTARFYVGCVILAFDYLHDRGIIYRDLKPENLLLDSSGYVKLTDFGFSRKLNGGEAAWTFCGTPEYVAPEIITNKSHDYRADIWSLGILVFELLTGAPPFTKAQSTAGQVYPEILKGMRGVAFPSCVSAAAAEIIRLCCRLAAHQRPALHHLKHFMWFSELDWAALADRSLSPPQVPKIENCSDHSNFDTYPVDLETPNDDYSDWSKDF